MFNSPPRSGNVFLLYLFSMFIDGQANKCLKITKYSDKSQKQAAFFRNPYNSIPSTIVKSRIDSGLSFDEDQLEEIKYSIENFAKEYLTAIKEAKANHSNIYIGKSEDMMKNPGGTIKDIALFFNLNIIENAPLINREVNNEIRIKMTEEKRTRVYKDGKVIIETLMSDHDGHMPREKIKERVFMDNLVKELNFDIVRDCYNEYMSIISTNAKEGQRWQY